MVVEKPIPLPCRTKRNRICATLLHPTPNHMEWCNAPKLFCAVRTIRTGPTTKLLTPWRHARELLGHGANGGGTPAICMMPLEAVAPAFFPPEVRAQATALACRLPADEGVPIARWTYAELAARLVALGIVVGIAISTLWRWFPADRIKPWAYRMGMHAHAPNFLERASAVLRLYEHAQQLLSQDEWVICVDEKTSIQAREGVDPPMPVIPGHPMKHAPRSKRNGSLTLFAALSIADGVVAGCSRVRKTFVDFQAFFLEIIVPEALRRGVRVIHMILDNGSTHAPKQIDAWLDHMSQSLPFTTQVVWLPTYASWLDQIEIWFSILQRKVLTPNHFISVDQLDDTIMRFIQHYNATAEPIAWSYTVPKLLEKFGKDL